MKEEWAERLGKRLEGHTMEPPEGLWESIAGEIDRGRAPRRRIAMAIAAAMTAAAVVVGGLMMPNREVATAPVDVITADNSVACSEQPADEPYDAAEPQKVVAQMITSTSSVTPDTVSDEAPETESTIEETSSPDIAEPVTGDASTDKPTPRATQRHEHQSPMLADKRPKARKESRLTLGLDFAGGIVDNGKDNYESYRTYTYAGNFQGGTGHNIFSEDNEFDYLSMTNVVNSTASHHLPVRVGLNVGYQLNRRWTVESGLSYTYLYSDISEEEENVVRFIKQRLHYVGIPVAAKYNIVCGKALNVYASGGAAVEKCVKGTGNITTEVDGEKNIKSHSDICEKPLQLSVNAAVGAEYRFTEGVSAYLEPSLGYYFKDNTELKHYYKDHPLAPSVKVGIRINVNGK